MPREFRQCWAHDTSGNRCTARAGHQGLHVRRIEWSDDQCAGASEPAPTQYPTSNIQPIPVDQDTPTEQCVACRHRHKGSECRCGCKEYIG